MSNIVAHDDAFYEADILHRDISVGNIVISEDGTGLLVDWDLCKVMDSASASERHAIERTVTKHHFLDI
jgi:RIO-like serine/threonine protein kinase